MKLHWGHFWNTFCLISNNITNQITSCFCCFLIFSFWSSLFWSIRCRFFSTIKTFLTIFTYPYLLHIFSTSLLNWISHFYNGYFILSSTSNGWLFWCVNHTSIASNSELNVFKGMKFVGKVSNKLPNDLFETNVYKPSESCW